MTGKIKCALIDLSGTIHIGKEAIKGSVDAVKKLEKNKIPFAFVSNTSQMSSSEIIEDLMKFGLPINKNNLFTSISATADLVRKNNWNPHLILSDSAQQDFKDILENPENKA